MNSLEFSYDIKAEVVSFCLDRLKNLYKDEGVAVNIFESVINTKYDSIKDFAARIMAVTSFISSDKAQSLIVSNKRVANILSKNASEDIKYSYNIEIAKTVGNEYELALAYSIEEISADLDKYLGNREYDYALELLTCLDKVIAEFLKMWWLWMMMLVLETIE